MNEGLDVLQERAEYAELARLGAADYVDDLVSHRLEIAARHERDAYTRRCGLLASHDREIARAEEQLREVTERADRALAAVNLRFTPPNDKPPDV